MGKIKKFIATAVAFAFLAVTIPAGAAPINPLCGVYPSTTSLTASHVNYKNRTACNYGATLIVRSSVKLESAAENSSAFSTVKGPKSAFSSGTSALEVTDSFNCNGKGKLKYRVVGQGWDNNDGTTITYSGQFTHNC